MSDRETLRLKLETGTHKLTIGESRYMATLDKTILPSLPTNDLKLKSNFKNANKSDITFFDLMQNDWVTFPTSMEILFND